MNRTLFFIVIFAILITTLSETVSVISGDHSLYPTVQDKCVKCHGDIKTQLSSSAQHSSYSCTFCHPRSAANHTNTMPDCADCHNVTKLNDTLEAHTNFAPMGSNGCIACHTTYNAVVNFTRPEFIEYNITAMPDGSWAVSYFNTFGTLNVSSSAKRNGGDHKLNNVSCGDCHMDIFDASSAGGHAVVLDKDGVQVQQHSISNLTMENWCRTCHARNDAQFPGQQHAARRTTCDECHQAYGESGHPGDFINTGIKTVPHLYRSLVCIACKSAGWQVPNSTIHFTVREEPYFNVVVTT